MLLNILIITPLALKILLRQINRGVSHNVAVDRIYQVYGQNQTVTNIINQMRKDKNTNNLHVSLK